MKNSREFCIYHELIIYGYDKDKENELRTKISRHLSGKRTDADIVIDCNEKNMTVKFVNMAAHSTIETTATANVTTAQAISCERKIL